MKLLKCICSIALLGLNPLSAQTTSTSYAAELSVPFGVVAGRLLTVGSVLVFYDTEKPDASFAVAREALASVTESAGVLTAELTTAVQDRSGPRKRLVFRLPDAASAPSLLAWSRTSASPAATKDSKDTSASLSKTYQVKHKHTFGGCSGSLIVQEGQVAFESISDLDHSRRWTLKDIKELKRGNPYALKVSPFIGSSYDFEVIGTGMGSEEFQALVERVTAARIK